MLFGYYMAGARETAAVSAHFMYIIQLCSMLYYFMQSHICRVYSCLDVTYHLHFWQNDRDVLRATAVTRGWNRYRTKSPAAPARIRTRDLAITSPEL